jgi:hypothetical protein
VSEQRGTSEHKREDLVCWWYVVTKNVAV